MQTIQNATNGAQFVEWYNDHTFAVWLGGHTVNFYRLISGTNEVVNTTCINVGSFKENEATLQEVKEGIENHFTMKDELGH